MNGDIKVIEGKFLVGTTKSTFIDGTNESLHEYLGIDSGGNISNKYKGKNFLWLGDSISADTGGSTKDGYPNIIVNHFGGTLKNLASSGGDTVRMRNICQGLNGEPTQDYSNIDYVFIMIGHNCDGVNGVANSLITQIPTDSTSYKNYPNGFHCDVASCIEYIREQNNNIEIFILTPIQSDNIRYDKTTPLAQKYLKEVANMYSCPVIDIYSIAGICKRNIPIYTVDNIHLNVAGKEKVANKIINQMLSY